MATAHLNGKRTGRPRGKKSAPAGLRAARFALRHLDDGAVAPSDIAPLVARLRAMDPAKLAAAVDEMEAQAQARAGSATPAPAPATATAPAAVPAAVPSPAIASPPSPPQPSEKPRGVRKLCLAVGDVYDFLRGRYLTWIARLPSEFEVTGVNVRRVSSSFHLILTICSDKLEPVPPGAPVPTWKVGDCFGWK